MKSNTFDYIQFKQPKSITGKIITIEELERRVAQLEENLKTIAYALGYRPEKKDEFANRYAIPADKLNCVGILEIGESNND